MKKIKSEYETPIVCGLVVLYCTTFGAWCAYRAICIYTDIEFDPHDDMDDVWAAAVWSAITFLTAIAYAIGGYRKYKWQQRFNND